MPIAVTTWITINCQKSPGGREAKITLPKGHYQLQLESFLLLLGLRIWSFQIYHFAPLMATQDWKASEAAWEAHCLLTSCFLSFLPPEASYGNQKSSSKWVIETGIPLSPKQSTNTRNAPWPSTASPGGDWPWGNPLTFLCLVVGHRTLISEGFCLIPRRKECWAARLRRIWADRPCLLLLLSINTLIFVFVFNHTSPQLPIHHRSVEQ